VILTRGSTLSRGTLNARYHTRDLTHDNFFKIKKK